MQYTYIYICLYIYIHTYTCICCNFLCFYMACRQLIKKLNTSLTLFSSAILLNFLCSDKWSCDIQSTLIFLLTDPFCHWSDTLIPVAVLPCMHYTVKPSFNIQTGSGSCLSFVDYKMYAHHLPFCVFCCRLADDNTQGPRTTSVTRDHLGMGSANERRRYIITSSLIGWAHIQNEPCSTSWLHGSSVTVYTVTNGLVDIPWYY